jgi:hypothetical protein
MMEKGIKLIALNFVSFMHYIATMLAFFVPIDIAHYYFGVPKFPSIMFGVISLWFWSFATGWVILRNLDKGE